MSRPAIPSELRRKVLVEAGHRCAIPTCKYADIEVHHIIPWERAQKHEYDNLIALCPNCHALAGQNKIDRKSLRLYKLRLQRLHRGENPDLLSEPPTSQQWELITISEMGGEANKFEIDIEYPRFKCMGGLEEINHVVTGYIYDSIQDFRRTFFPPEKEPWSAYSSSSYMTKSFEVVILGEDYLSLRFVTSGYNAGAAHPHSHTRAFNYWLDPVFSLQLSDFFEKDAPFFEIISNAVRSDLIGRLAKDEYFDSARDWIITGTEPKYENFKTFNFDTTGLTFTFDAYQVGPYAAGSHDVTLKFGEIPSLLPLEKLRLREVRSLTNGSTRELA